jgi:hypothetical protein
VIYAHVPGEILTSDHPDNPDTPVFVDNAGGRVLTAAQVAAWCRAPQTTKVTVKKVVDLNQHIACNSYTPSAELAEHVRLRDRRRVLASDATPRFRGVACAGSTKPRGRSSRTGDSGRPFVRV